MSLKDPPHGMKAKRIALQTILNTAKVVVFFRSFKELYNSLVLITILNNSIMKANEVKNTVKENVNTVENAQKLAKEQENPSYVAMFRPWIVEACGGLVDDLTQAINETITDANETDERYKQLSKDYEKAKARFEAYQLKTVNGDRQTIKAFKKAVAVAVLEVAEHTNTGKWFTYRNLYGLGLLNELPSLINTPNKVNSFVAKAFVFMQQYAKRSSEMARKERQINEIMTRFNLPRETAEAMYLAGALKI